MKLRVSFCCGLMLLLLLACQQTHQPALKPNILWIVSEDNSPLLGCYGDSLATTPNIDRLAAEGMLYTHAFSNAPVCAPARHTLITGTYASGNGTENMRSTFPIDSTQIHFFPYYLREQGYYTANRHKTDYNTLGQAEVWDASEKEAHYRNRKPGQPFFQVVNIGTSHEGRLHGTPPDPLLHDPQKMILPPYHPDTEVIRRDRAWYYDKISQMDQSVGELIDELKAEGLYEETIIFYYSDHGGILARSKRHLYESGQHVPFVVRVPEKYQALFPDYKPGINEKLISFVDLAPTLLDLAGIKPKAYFDGKAINQETRPRDYVYGFIARVGDKMEMARSVRDKRYLLIRNFLPEYPGGKYNDYLYKQATIQSWKQAYEKGECNEIQSAFWEPRPAIELFDCDADPHNVHNLAEQEAVAAKQSELEKELKRWMIAERDKGIIHELERRSLPEIQAIDQWSAAQYSDLLDFVCGVAENQSLADAALAQFLSKDKHYQYWALHYLLKNQKTIAEPLTLRLRDLLRSPSVPVQINAALVLLKQGDQSGVKVLEKLLTPADVWQRFYVLEGISKLNPEQRKLFQESIHRLAIPELWKRYDARMALNLEKGVI